MTEIDDGDRTAVADQPRVTAVAMQSSPIDKATIRKVLTTAAEVVVPTSFLVSLAYYFGLVRTRKLYTELGVDDSILEFSTTDYLLRSLTVLVVPIPWLFVGVVAGVLTYLVAARLLEGRRAGGLFVAVVVACVAFAVPWFTIDGIHPSGTRPDPEETLILLIVGLVAAVVVWVAALSEPHGVKLRKRLPTAAVASIAAAGLLMLSFLAFEAVRARALEVGARLAIEAEATPQDFPCVVVTTDLALTVGDEIAGQSLESGFQAYEGLRLFVKSGSGYLLFPDDRSPRAGLFLLREDRVASLDFQPQRNDEWQPCPRAG